jgi:hypothetical protein
MEGEPRTLTIEGKPETLENFIAQLHDEAKEGRRANRINFMKDIGRLGAAGLCGFAGLEISIAQPVGMWSITVGLGMALASFVYMIDYPHLHDNYPPTSGRSKQEIEYLTGRLEKLMTPD